MSTQEDTPHVTPPHLIKICDAVEFAVEAERLKPFEAIELAEHFGFSLPDWILAKHRHYVENSPKPKQRKKQKGKTT